MTLILPSGSCRGSSCHSSSKYIPMLSCNSSPYQLAQDYMLGMLTSSLSPLSIGCRCWDGLVSRIIKFDSSVGVLCSVSLRNPACSHRYLLLLHILNIAKRSHSAAAFFFSVQIYLLWKKYLPSNAAVLRIWLTALPCCTEYGSRFWRGNLKQ